MPFDLYGYTSEIFNETSLFDFLPTVDTFSGAFTWLKDNPEAAAALGGVAGAGLQYLANRESIAAQKELQQQQQAFKLGLVGASSVGPEAYGKNLNITQQQPGITQSPVGQVQPQAVGFQMAQPQSMGGVFAQRAAREDIYDPQNRL